jgi:L-ascorbate metabolism protein UlaG (beta-lactamase superfamily)
MPDGLWLRWLGHASVVLELGGVRLLTDPLLRDGLGPLRRHGPRVEPAWYADVDGVLVSHLHRDHLDLPSLRQLAPRTRVMVPRGAGALVSRAGLRRVEELAPGEATTIGRVKVLATPANHAGDRPPSGPTGPALGYVVEGPTRVYFAGDTDLFPQMSDLAPGLDLALLPVGGWGPTLGPGHLNPHRAAQALRLLRPRAAVPIHWGTLWPLGLRARRSSLFSAPGREFTRHAAELASEVEVHVLPVGHALHLPISRPVD